MIVDIAKKIGWARLWDDCLGGTHTNRLKMLEECWPKGLGSDALHVKRNKTRLHAIKWFLLATALFLQQIIYVVCTPIDHLQSIRSVHLQVSMLCHTFLF